ncbi:hypothetical protein N6H14_16460 [Paenibacillus sp. CC-CFT747]|nr:hypothetical protein N6H14_16460 [Paenibacillus sp. CC-CFT747]
MFGEKDDLETSRNRTKFFDFIIPVVPIINSSNSGEVLKDKLKRDNIGAGITENFINDITIYIDDMRILKNIFNEYILYKNKLGVIKLIPNNLLAMIVYKNIYPSDFAKLHFNEGMVYSVFQKKTELVHNRIIGITNNIDEIESKITRTEQESLTSIEELTIAYGFAIFGFNNNTTVAIDGSNYNVSSTQTMLTNIRETSSVRIFNGYNWVDKTYEELVTAFNTRESYFLREEAIKIKIENRLNDLKIKLQQLKQLKEEIKLYSIVELINDCSLEEVFEGQIEKERLLIFLLRNGYIDETYHQYITYFYPGSVSIDDMRFIMSVKNQESLPINYKLNKIIQVIERLYANDFKRPEILNIDLLNFLFSSNFAYNPFFKSIMYQLSNESEKSIEFVDSFRNNTPYKEKFINELSKEWNGFWKFVQLDSMYPEEKKEAYLLDILYFASTDDIKLMNKDNILVNYIEEKKNFLGLLTDDSQHQKINEIITALNIKFRVMSPAPQTNKVFEHIYLNNYYQINQPNIDLLLETFGASIKDKTLFFENILKSNCPELIGYVDENINQYIDSVYLDQGIINEEEDVIAILLNNNEIDVDLRQRIISKQKVLITDLKKIVAFELWPEIIINNKLRPTWKNLIEYLGRHQLDEVATSFLNQDTIANELSKYKLSALESVLSKELKDISEMIIDSRNISDESFNIISKSLHRFTGYPLKELSIERIRAMINNGILALSPKIL